MRAYNWKTFTEVGGPAAAFKAADGDYHVLCPLRRFALEAVSQVYTSSFRKREMGGAFPPKWMVKIMEKPIKMDDLGIPWFLETPIWDFTWLVGKTLQGSLMIFACFRSGSFEDDDFPKFPRWDMWSFPGFFVIFCEKTLIFESFASRWAERTIWGLFKGRSVVLQLWGADLFLLFYLWSFEIFWLLQTWCGYISCEPWLGQPWWWKRLCLWKLREK